MVECVKGYHLGEWCWAGVTWHTGGEGAMSRERAAGEPGCVGKVTQLASSGHCENDFTLSDKKYYIV